MINLKNLNNLALDKKKIIFIVLATVIFLYLDINFLMKLQVAGIREINPKIIKIKSDLNDFHQDSTKIQELKKKQAGKKPGIILKSKKVITAEEVPALLQVISQIANKNTIKIIQIKSGKELKRSADKAALPSTGNLSVLLIALDLTGDYHYFGKFIADLENAEMLLAVEEMKITVDAKDYFKQKMNLVLRAYVGK